MNIKLALCLCLLSVIVVVWAGGERDFKSMMGRTWRNDHFEIAGVPGMSKHHLNNVLSAHNLDVETVYNLMEQHGLDESSLLQLLADVGHSAALVLEDNVDEN